MMLAAGASSIVPAAGKRPGFSDALGVRPYGIAGVMMPDAVGIVKLPEFLDFPALCYPVCDDEVVFPD